MGKPKAPKAPDPKETASASTSTNVGTAIANSWLNNTNQITPDGNLTYNQSGSYKWNDPYTGKTYDVPTFTATQTLSPQQQAIKDQNDQTNLNLGKLANSQSGRLNDLLGKPFSLDGAPAAGDPSKIADPTYQNFDKSPNLKTSYVDDFSQDRQRVEDTLMTRLQTGLDKDRLAMEQRLADQGIQSGSQGYKNAMDDYSRSKNDARSSAILSAGQEQSRLAGLARDQATFGNNANQQMWQNNFNATQGNNSISGQKFQDAQKKFDAQNVARDKYISEQFALRNQPINEIIGLMNGSQVQHPNFVNTPGQQIATTDVGGLINTNYQQRLGAYQQQMAQSQGLLGGLFGLGAAGIMASDRRVKKDINKVGETDGGQNIYSFRYKSGGPMQLGLMAQEVEKDDPGAVVEIGGIKHVNYPRALSLGSSLRKAA